MRVSSVGTSTSLVLGFSNCSTYRRNIGIIRLYKAQLSADAVKRANLSSRKRERIKLPNYDDISGTKDTFHIREFLRHPSGIESILNTSALQSYYSIDSNTYRCILPRLQLLNFEVSPELDLQVTPTSKNCLVEMLSCKFEGSEIVERQNEHFSERLFPPALVQVLLKKAKYSYRELSIEICSFASMTNTITWDTRDSDSYLNVDVRLNLSLEIYTKPFSLLPVSAVETPGNLMMQALVDRLVPLLLQQLLRDYDKWVKQQRQNFPEDLVPN